MRRSSWVGLGVSVAVVSACGGGGGGGGSSGSSSSSSSGGALSTRCDVAPAITTPGTISVTTLASGLQNPWGLAFLPDGSGRALITERPGRMRLMQANGSLSSPIANLPAVQAQGQGGLLDVVLDPAFASNNTIYWSYSEAGTGGTSGTAVARGVLNLNTLSLSAVTVIYRQQPKLGGNNHYGSRLVFANDGSLFVTLGDRQVDPTQGAAHPAQNPDQPMGKVVRITSAGGVPPDNPFAAQSGERRYVWSLGHRNPQGATIHPLTGQLWIGDHGAQGGDEINLAQPGRNYGWPVISYGLHYGGAAIGEGAARQGMEQPLCYWDPSIAPANMVFYTAGNVPAWQGNLFVAVLKDTSLVRLSFNGTQPSGYQRIAMNARIRDVRVGPDGWLYLLTDENPGEVRKLVVQ
ncbi:PQQ-dependent sugar dehydrogenase [Uliginosibacterium sp. H1]|uniref:PQQ-dependent sugar dehydrogenase n=1 Tax=Uliginosibacterium sp. H1 TaxID=3114757 RepID=UPI002E172070|nr:PQQ-dependent sugar dehydrogenase [Uliginosibacterium sp. H1]